MIYMYIITLFIEKFQGVGGQNVVRIDPGFCQGKVREKSGGKVFEKSASNDTGVPVRAYVGVPMWACICGRAYKGQCLVVPV